MQEDFKNIIKKTVDNHSDDINPDMIWKGIENKMGKRKKNKFAGYLVCGLIAISLISWVGYFIFFSSDNSSVIEQIDYVDSEEIKVTNEELKMTKSIDKVIVVSEDKESSAIVTKEEYQKEEHDNSIRVDNVDSKKIVSNESINESSERVDNSTAVKEVAVWDKNDKSRAFLLTKNAESQSPTKTDIELGSAKESKSKISIDEIELSNFSLAIPQRTLSNQDHEEFTFDTQYADDESNFSIFSGIELYSGLSFGNKNISYTNQSYADVRNNSEQLLEQWSAGVRLDVLRVMDFQVQSGIRYSIITDRLLEENEYKDLNEYTYKRSRLIGDAIVVIDSMMQIDTSNINSTYTIEQYNSQRVISIPIEVSFGKSFGRFDLGLGFGVDINYQLADTHVILDQEGLPTVNKVGGEWVSPSFSGALLAGYKINDNWSIISRANFRGLTLSDHETISTLRSNYKLFGVELGIKRRIAL